MVSIDTWRRYLRKLPGKLPGNIYFETAQFSAAFAEAAAEHQRETGFLKQRGYGGSPFSPQYVEREMVNLRYSRIL
jgi:hypothetical protein